MSKQYFEKLDTEKLAGIKKTNLEKFEFSVIDEMTKAESSSKEIVKKITATMNGSTKMFKDMEKFAKQATKEVNGMIKKYNAELKLGGKLKDELEKQMKINMGIFEDVNEGAKALGMSRDDIKGFKGFNNAENALMDVRNNDEYDYLGESFSEENWRVG
tara:strand:+ start:620 stop:1096 length:477 start_codon:yes stop_codon:yes gene_type:complete